MGRKIRKFRTDKFYRYEKRTKILTPVTHGNGWFPAVYASYMNQNFRSFLVSNLSVLNFRIFLLMYPGSMIRAPIGWGYLQRAHTGCVHNPQQFTNTSNDLSSFERKQYRYSQTHNIGASVACDRSHDQMLWPPMLCPNAIHVS